MNNLPEPPRGAHPVQLELWSRVFTRRFRQMEALSPSIFDSFAFGIKSDYDNSRREMDLTNSHYSSYLLKGSDTDATENNNDSNNNGSKNDSTAPAKQIGFHILALFYTAIDERMPPPERQFAIDTVKRAFALLDTVMSEERGKQQQQQQQHDASNNGNNDNVVVVGKHGRDEGEIHDDNNDNDDYVAEMPKTKHARKEPPIVDGEGEGEAVNNEAQKNNDNDENIQNNMESELTPNDDGGAMSGTKPNEAPVEHNNDNSSEIMVIDDGDNDELSKTSSGQNEDNTGGDNMQQLDALDTNKGNNYEGEESQPFHDALDVEGESQPFHDAVDEEEEVEDVTGLHHAAGGGGDDDDDGDVEDVTEQHVAEGNDVEDATEEQSTVRDFVQDVTEQTTTQPITDSKAAEEETQIANEDVAAKSSQEDDMPNNDSLQQPTGATTDEPTSEIEIDDTQLDPLPPPRIGTLHRHINFYADNFINSRDEPKETVSGSIHARDPCTVVYDSGYHHLNYCATLDDETSVSINERLAMWDPYWRTLKVLCKRDTESEFGEPTKVTTKTASCKDETGVRYPPKSCAMVSVNLSKESRDSKFAGEWEVNWGKESNSYSTGERRLLLRTLPLTRSSTEVAQRADTHLWPKGTFVQLKVGDEAAEKVVRITQRKQDEIEPAKWTGQCSALDLTPYVQNPNLPIDVKLCSREAIRKAEPPPIAPGTKVVKEFEDAGQMVPFNGEVKSYDAKEKLYLIVYEDEDSEELTREEVSNILVVKGDLTTEDPPTIGSYAVHVTISEYVGPDRLFDGLVGKSTLPLLPLESVKQKAIEYLKQQQIVVVDGEDESDNNNGGSNSGSLIVSLKCPIGKTTIQTPVRSKHCNHLQCFDLRNFLLANEKPSARRFRCGVCQRILCLKDLVRCGLFDAMLRDHQADIASSTSHEVSILDDGSWRIVEQKKAKSPPENVDRDRGEESEVIDLS